MTRNWIEAGRFSSPTKVIEAALSQLGDCPPMEPVAEPPTVFDLLDRAGLIGCLNESSTTLTDLSTNPAHMDGFGGE